MKKEVIIVLIVILLIFVGIWQLNSLKKISNADKTRECVKDEDCFKVQTDCCSCNSGGEEKCVSKTEQDTYLKIAEDCKKQEAVFCAQVYNCVIEKCSCVEGKCAG